jgi:hypothetical protein
VAVRDLADIVRLADGPPLELHHRHRTIAPSRRPTTRGRRQAPRCLAAARCDDRAGGLIGRSGPPFIGSLKRALGDLDRVTAWLMAYGVVNADPGCGSRFVVDRTLARSLPRSRAA